MIIIITARPYTLDWLLWTGNLFLITSGLSVSPSVQSSDCKRPTTTNKERLLYELRKYTSDSTHRYVLHVRLRVVMLNSMRNQLTLGQAEASMAFFLLRLHLAVFNKGHTIVFALSRGAAKISNTAGRSLGSLSNPGSDPQTKFLALPAAR